ncbi:MAG: hypothetical protein AB7G28_06155 [Pirellulales bacterium]
MPLSEPMSVEYGPELPAEEMPVYFEPPAEDCSTPKPIFIAPQEGWVQPVQPLELVPIMPLPESAGPRPGSIVGPMFGAPEQLPLPGQPGPPAPPPEASSPLSSIAPGGKISPQFGLPVPPEEMPGGAPPIFVPAANDEYAWEQITDVVSDYFTISREQQVRRSGEAWSEGKIETRYQGGATWLEPFRKDSVGAFNRWESTFQTIRRRATVRVAPDPNGYVVEVIVEKELEDLPHPERSTSGVAAFPNDFSLPSGRSGDVSRTLSSPRWIQLGRDKPLEAKMLADIHARLNGVTAASNTGSIWQ